MTDVPFDQQVIFVEAPVTLDTVLAFDRVRDRVEAYLGTIAREYFYLTQDKQLDHMHELYQFSIATNEIHLTFREDYHSEIHSEYVALPFSVFKDENWRQKLIEEKELRLAAQALAAQEKLGAEVAQKRALLERLKRELGET